MPRYIDADLLMKELGITDPDCVKCEWGSKLFPYCTRDGDFVDACDAICEAPTADVVERKVGKWIEAKPMSGRIGKVCSACGCEAYWDSDYGQQLFDWCPYCGAEMRGEDDE